MKFKDMEGGIKETLLLRIEGDVIQDESGREVGRVCHNKVVLGTEEQKLRLVIIKPVTKPIKSKEEKEVAKELIMKARLLVEFLDPNNNLPIFYQVTSEPIWNQKGVKRKRNSQHEGGSVGESGTFVADRRESDTPATDTPTDPADWPNPTTQNSNQGVPATLVLNSDLMELTQSELDEHAIAIPAGSLPIILLLVLQPWY